MEPYNEREPQDVRILWGRVVALGAALLVAFLLGTWVAGGDDGVDQETYDELVDDLRDLEDENERLDAQLEELSQAGRPGERPDGEDADGDELDDEAGGSQTDDETADDEAGSQVYIVRQNDTLSQLAQRFYGSPGMEARERIAEANDIEPDATLTVGQELTIPPADG